MTNIISPSLEQIHNWTEAVLLLWPLETLCSYFPASTRPPVTPSAQSRCGGGGHWFSR